MSMIAVDIVLLPPEPIMSLAIGQNRLLVQRYGSEIVLDRTQCLPHISLMMGCMDSAQLDKVHNLLQQVITTADPGPLSIMGIAIICNQPGKQVSSFLIKKTDQLQRLHETLFNLTGDLFSYEVDPSMICCQQPVSQTTLDWIRHFRRDSSLAMFWPHITLGYGIAQPIERPVSFNAPSLAICHLGNNCTCRKLLIEVELKSSH